MQEYILLLIMLIPVLGAIFALTATDDKNSSSNNVYNIAIWTLFVNVILILYALSHLDIEKSGVQFVEKYNWLKYPFAELFVGADIFSMLLILSINFSFFVAQFYLRHDVSKAKTLIVSTLLFISLINGYLIAADILSFYIFFASISIPMIILISTYGSIRKKNILIRFSLYSFIGCLLLFIATMVIYCYKSSNIPLNTVSYINLPNKLEYFVWFSIFFAFLSHMPIWPFHYWISSINSTLKHPLVFIIGNLIPLVGLYGFIRFWPNTVPDTISIYAPFFVAICVITILFMSLISLSHKDFRYKLYTYMTVYYLLYLIGVFLPTSVLKINIGYSLFSFFIIITILSFLISHIEKQKKKLSLYAGSGILCYMPKTSKSVTLFVLACIGLPITPLFWNNFIIIAEIFNYNLVLGTAIMLSLFFISLSLLEELYRMKDKSYATVVCNDDIDLSNKHFYICIICLIILFFSFVKPWWFVF